MIHTTSCQLSGFTGDHTDAAKRIRDEYALHRIADPIGNIGKWFAVSLAEGKSDHTLYDSRRDAVTHMHHDEERFAYIQIVPSTMNYCEAEAFLNGARKMASAGIRLTDRDHRAGGREVIRRATNEDQNSLLRSILSRGQIPAANLRLPRR